MRKFPWSRLLALSFGAGAASGAAVTWRLLGGDPFQEQQVAVAAASADLLRQQQQMAAARLGLPASEHMRFYSDYILAYDRRHRSAAWVFEHLTPEKANARQPIDRSKLEFMPDQSQPPMFRAENSDYKGSGYDRGHLAAAGNHGLDYQMCQETFLLSNIAPQVGAGFNRDGWNNLEKFVRSLGRKYQNVYVCTGPAFLPIKHSNGRKYVSYEVIGANHVSVPTHFFKVILIDLNNGYFELLSYMMPNVVLPENIALDTFLVPLDAIQRASGLLFFDRLPTNRIVRINKKNVQ